MQRHFDRELSSVGLEHLPYKQGVTSSNLVVPTKKERLSQGSLFFYLKSKVPSLKSYLLEHPIPTNLALVAPGLELIDG